MKFGFRKPSIKKSIKARTTGKIKKKMKTKEVRGITIISLVVTIVVLLILAGITNI